MKWINSILLTFFMSFIARSKASCEISNSSVSKHRTDFQGLVSAGNKLIYVYINSSFLKENIVDEFHRNRILEWIWVTRNYKHFLGYPLDLDVLTLNVMRRDVDVLRLNIDLVNETNCVNVSDPGFIRSYLTNILVFNESISTCKSFFDSDVKRWICHRFFENQEFKRTLFDLSHVSIGYDFQCYSSKPNVVTQDGTHELKSRVVYLIVALVLLAFLFTPTYLSVAIPDETKCLFEHYRKSDYPYSPRRLFRYVLFYKNCCKFDCLVRFTLITFLCCVLFFVLKRSMLFDLPTPLSEYPRVYDTTIEQMSREMYAFKTVLFTIWFLIMMIGLFYLSKDQGDTFLLLDVLGCLDRGEFALPNTKTRCGPLKTVSVHSVLAVLHAEECKSICRQTIHKFYLLVSVRFWTIIFLEGFRFAPNRNLRWICVSLAIIQFPINVCVTFLLISCPLLNYTFQSLLCLLQKFTEINSNNFYIKTLQKITGCLSTVLSIGYMFALYYYFTDNVIIIGFTYFFQATIYLLLVAAPHLYATNFRIFLFWGSSILYLLLYIIESFDLYKVLLNKILKINGTSEIKIRIFEKIAGRFFPLRLELFVVIGKICVTFMILFIIYDTLKFVHYLDEKSSFDLHQVFSLLFTLTPGLLEKYFIESNKDKVTRLGDEIRDYLMELNENPPVAENTVPCCCDCCRVIGQIVMERREIYTCDISCSSCLLETRKNHNNYDEMQ
ncbi:uncharacterized protein LOC134240285 [Saccostrea cucullata]|uniref:uncharacterized protein LOC134240285 n=1 Tax=Saccostrea cuccullata TaxID=36930 RepID=UPI002ED4E2B4